MAATAGMLWRRFSMRSSAMTRDSTPGSRSTSTIDRRSPPGTMSGSRRRSCSRHPMATSWTALSEHRAGHCYAVCSTLGRCLPRLASRVDRGAYRTRPGGRREVMRATSCRRSADDDLAEYLALHEVPIGLRRLVEAEDAIDHRAQLRGGDGPIHGLEARPAADEDPANGRQA